MCKVNEVKDSLGRVAVVTVDDKYLTIVYNKITKQETVAFKPNCPKALIERIIQLKSMDKDDKTAFRATKSEYRATKSEGAAEYAEFLKASLKELLKGTTFAEDPAAAEYIDKTVKLWQKTV